MTTRHLIGRLVGVLLVCLGLQACTDAQTAKREYAASGDRFFAQQKYAEAIVQYRNALQYDAQFGEVRFKLAESYERVGDARNSYREHIRAADALPGSVEAQVKAGFYLLLAGQFEEARVRAQKALKLDPKSATAQVLMGDSLAGLKNFEQALSELEAAVRLDPKSAAAYASIAAVHAATGANEDAEAAYRKAVETSPKLALTHMALANFLWATGRQNEAEGSFQQALALEPGNVMVRRALATFYVATGRGALAEPHLKALAASDTSRSAPWKLTLADYYLASNRPDDAIKVLEGLASNTDAYSASRTRMAAIDYSRKGPAQAKQEIDEVLKRDPKNVPALLVKANFLISEKDFQSALTVAQAAASADPASVQAQYLVGTIRRSLKQPAQAIQAFTEVLKLNPRAVAAQVQLTELNLELGKVDASLQLAQDAARELPNDPVVQLALIRSLTAKRELPRAEAMARALLARNPKFGAAQAAMGRILFARNDRKGARSAFTRAAEADPLSLDALTGLVALDLLEKNVPSARSRTDAYLKADPNSAPALVLSARVYWVMGKFDEVERDLRHAVEANPSDMNTYSLLGQLYSDQKRLPEARATFEAMAKKEPDSIAAHTTLATLYTLEGNRPAARQQFERVLQIDPTAPVAANNLAYMYAEDGGNLDLALQLAQIAKQQFPDAPDVNDTLGWVYVRKGLPALAIPLLEQAVTAAKDDATIQFHLAQAYLKSGDKAKARRAFERLDKLNPDATLSSQISKAKAEL